MKTLRALLQRCEAALRSADETPHDAALALAVGVFISFSPFLGLQIVITIAVGWLFKLNRILLFVGLCTNLPWLVAPYYAATTEAAAWLMGVSPPSQLASRLTAVFAHSVWSAAFWRALGAELWPLLWPFVLGSTITAAVLAVVAYRVGLAVASRRRTA